VEAPGLAGGFFLLKGRKRPFFAGMEGAGKGGAPFAGGEGFPGFFWKGKLILAGAPGGKREKKKKKKRGGEEKKNKG